MTSNLTWKTPNQGKNQGTKTVKSSSIIFLWITTNSSLDSTKGIYHYYINRFLRAALVTIRFYPKVSRNQWFVGKLVTRATPRNQFIILGAPINQFQGWFLLPAASRNISRPNLFILMHMHLYIPRRDWYIQQYITRRHTHIIYI